MTPIKNNLKDLMQENPTKEQFDDTSLGGRVGRSWNTIRRLKEIDDADKINLGLGFRIASALGVSLLELFKPVELTLKSTRNGGRTNNTKK